MGWLKKLSKTIRKIDPLTSKVIDKTAWMPGTPSSAVAAIESDAPSGSLFGAGASKSDIFAGGTKLSKSPKARAVGRAVGTFYAAGAAGVGTSGAVKYGISGLSASLGASAAAEQKALLDAENARFAQELADNAAVATTSAEELAAEQGGATFEPTATTHVIKDVGGLDKNVFLTGGGLLLMTLYLMTKG